MIFKILVLCVVSSQIICKNIRQTWGNADDAIPGLSWLFDVELPTNSNAEAMGSGVCKTKECQIIANEFSRSMNKSVKPCDNFYDYVCGALSRDVIPPYKPNWGRTDLFQQVIYRRMKEILETKPMPSDILPLRQAKKWYRSCMDTEVMKRRGLKPIDSILMQVGGWPMVIDPEEWDDGENSWQHIEQHYFETTGSYIFFKFSYDGNSEITMEPGLLPLNEKLPSEYRDYDDDNYEAYTAMVEGVAQLFVKHNKADVSAAMIKKDARNLVEFEKELYEIASEWGYKTMSIDDWISMYNHNETKYENSPTNDINRDDEDNTDIDSEFEKINFQEIFETMFDLIDHNVNSSMMLEIKNYKYFVKLTQLINKTPKRTVVNYMHWHFVSEMLAFTTEEMRNLFFELMENVFDVKERSPRWLECVDEMKMIPAAAYAFVKKYYSNKTDAAAREMVNNIRKQMEIEIENSSWMDDKSRELIVEKLKNMKALIGFPELFNNRTAVIHAYKGLIIGSDHFDNVLSYKKYELKEWLRSAINPNDDDTLYETYMDPLEVNAAYNLYGNIIELPAADFQPPLFTSKLPWSVNYGIAGVAIGHEIGHAFDDDSIKFGINGMKTRISKQMLDMYYKRAECFLDQFNKYYGVTESDYGGSTPEYSEQSKSRKTRGENIADTTGLHSVYDAYMKKVERDMGGSDYKLPGFEDYTDSQMFFISFAAIWCEAKTPRYEEILHQSDEHSPGHLRVIGGVSNVNAFSEAFNCPKGSPMNPDNKCNIWKSSKPSKKKNHKPKSVRRHRKHRKGLIRWSDSV